MSGDNSENDDTPHLDCPRCGSKMGDHLGHAGWLAACPGCGGTWFDNAFCVAIAADEVHWSDRRLIRTSTFRAFARPRFFDAKTPLNVGCPVCGERLVVSVIDGGVMIDACPSHGTFFDRGELRSYRVERSRLRLSPSNRPPSLETTQVMAAMMQRLERLHTTSSPGSDSPDEPDQKAHTPVRPSSRRRKAAKVPDELRCPGCAAPTKAWSSPAGLLATCPRCAGVWLDNSACVVLTHGKLLEADVAFVTRFEGQSLSQRPLGPFRQASVPRACPICTKLLTPTQAEGMTTDACLEHGMYFDVEELGQLHALYGEQARVEAEAEAGTVRAWLRRTLGFQD